MAYSLGLGDCLEHIKSIPVVDVVITDPPYPDYWSEEYLYRDGLLNFLKGFNCRQFIFWSAKAPFPLDFTAAHIWDKKVGRGSEYERIFERKGQTNYKMFRYYLINSTVAASYSHDLFTGYPSQKPIGLIRELVEKYTNPGDTVFDPFMGSGTTGVACMQLGRNFIGCEIKPKYFAIAEKRIKDASMQPQLFAVSETPRFKEVNYELPPM
ncbi:MAG: site-specific DNA-methyltransferase [Anaerolineales bacterium]|jgi:DNA modification methylase